MPVFSVIIPIYNKEAYIEATLKSVLEQTFTDFEIVIVNDGSTDNSLDIVNKVLQNFDNKTIVSQKNKGLSATRNKAISIANGEIIALLDADDLWHNDFLDTIFKLHKTFKEANVYGTDYLEKNITSNKILETNKTIDQNLKGKSFLVDDFFTLNLGQPIICQSSLAFKKTIFEKIGFDESVNYAEDIDFYITTFSKHKLAYLYDAKATIITNDANQMTSVGLNHKTIPNFEVYKTQSKPSASLKKYLNFQQYCFALEYRKYGNYENFKDFRSKINQTQLNIKQRFLLNAPNVIFKSIYQTKSILKNVFGIKWNTY